MANDDKPGWVQISFKQPIQDLIEHGPTAKIKIAGTPYEVGQPVRSVLALFDPGSAGTAISVRLADLLDVKSVGSANVQELGREPIATDFFPVRLFIPDLTFDTRAAALPFAPPHDVIIGRDFLSNRRILVDFTTGVTTLCFKAD